MSDAAPALARLAASARPRVLFASHERGGGVARHVADLAALLADDAEVLLLQPDSPTLVALRWLRAGEDLTLWFPRGGWERLVAFLASLGIDRVHFHHVDGLPEAVLDLPTRLGCPHDLTLHDFYPACPAYNLADAGGRFCGGGPGCERCLEGREATWPWTIAQWREAFSGLLATAGRVIAPSEDAARRIRAFFPDVKPVVWPHPEPQAPFPVPPLRVLVPGAMSAVKGLAVLEACVADAARRGLPLHFVVVGFLGRPLPQWPDAPLTVTGQFREADLARLMARERGDVVFFPAQCPETFSYTLSVALDSGLPVVASDLGALPERLRGHPGAKVVPWDASAAQLNDALLAARPAPAAPAASARPRMTADDYRARYLAAFDGARRASIGSGVPAIDPAWTQAPVRPLPSYPLAYLYEDGIECGKASSRELLRRYAFDPDSMHAGRDERFMALVKELGAERETSARHVAEMKAQADRADAKVAELESRLRLAEGGLLARLARWLRGG